MHPTTPSSSEAPRRNISIKQFSASYGVGVTSAYKLIATGQLKAVKIGKLTRIRVEDAEAWNAQLPVRKSA